jgi:hypothetical protein
VQHLGYLGLTGLHLGCWFCVVFKLEQNDKGRCKLDKLRQNTDSSSFCSSTMGGSSELGWRGVWPPFSDLRVWGERGGRGGSILRATIMGWGSEGRGPWQPWMRPWEARDELAAGMEKKGHGLGRVESMVGKLLGYSPWSIVAFWPNSMEHQCSVLENRESLVQGRRKGAAERIGSASLRWRRRAARRRLL